MRVFSLSELGDGRCLGVRKDGDSPGVGTDGEDGDCPGVGTNGSCRGVGSSSCP